MDNMVVGCSELVTCRYTEIYSKIANLLQRRNAKSIESLMLRSQRSGQLFPNGQKFLRGFELSDSRKRTVFIFGLTLLL